MLKTFHTKSRCPGTLAIRTLGNQTPAGLPARFFNPYASQPNHSPSGLLAVGIPEGVDSVIYGLYASRFTKITAWSQSILSCDPGEIIRIMIRNCVLRR